MKSLTRIISLFALAILLPSLALASEQHKSVNIDKKAIVANQTLTPGNYTLRWDDSQPNTMVEFQKNGKTVATVPAQVIHQASPHNASYEINTAFGQNRLDHVYFSNEQLAFGGNSSPNTQSTSSPSTPPSE